MPVRYRETREIDIVRGRDSSVISLLYQEVGILQVKLIALSRNFR